GQCVFEARRAVLQLAEDGFEFGERLLERHRRGLGRGHGGASRARRRDHPWRNKFEARNPKFERSEAQVMSAVSAVPLELSSFEFRASNFVLSGPASRTRDRTEPAATRSRYPTASQSRSRRSRRPAATSRRSGVSATTAADGVSAR